MKNDYLASSQNNYFEPVYTGRALHTEGAWRAEPLYTGLHAGGALHTGVQQNWFRIFMNPMFIIILVCRTLFIFVL